MVGSHNYTRTPPMVRGLPLVGSFLEWRRDHMGVFQRAYRQHGPVFGIQLGPQRGVVLVGPRYHDLFFKEVDQKLSVPELYKFIVPMFGEVIMAARDQNTRRRHVALLQSAFQGRRLEQYTSVMVAETNSWLTSLGKGGRFDVWDAFEPLSMRIGASALMGPEIRERINVFRPLLADLARGMEFILPPNLPLPRFRRRDRAHRILSEMTRNVLVDRRSNPGGSDFLQTLVDDPTLHREGDDALVGMALATIFTGYITTAAQLSWALVLLLQNPSYLSSVVAEIDEERGKLTSAEFPVQARLPRLEWALKEAIRLRPVMSHYARTTVEDYTVDGYRIPSGWLTILCPAVAHRLPEIFVDPECYDPERFNDERAEDKQHPHALIGFSGGFYRCPGSAFGMNEMKVVLSMLLARYHVELVTPEPSADFDMGVTRPGSPCYLQYTDRSYSTWR